MIVCIKCKQSKPESSFYIKSYYDDKSPRYSSQCKVCQCKKDADIYSKDKITKERKKLQAKKQRNKIKNMLELEKLYIKQQIIKSTPIKLCKTCKKEKSIHEFNWTSSKTWFSAHCKICERQKEKERKRPYREHYRGGSGGKADIWRINIYKKFNYACSNPNCKNTKNLVAHHIFPWADFPAFRYDINNGICLCKKCHTSFHNTHGMHKYFNNWMS